MIFISKNHLYDDDDDQDDDDNDDDNKSALTSAGKYNMNILMRKC